jgi:hypothetical protein
LEEAFGGIVSWFEAGGAWGWGKGVRRGCAEAEAARAACYDGDFAFEGEERGEVEELCFGHGDGGWESVSVCGGCDRLHTVEQLGSRKMRFVRSVGCSWPS